MKKLLLSSVLATGLLVSAFAVTGGKRQSEEALTTPKTVPVEDLLAYETSKHEKTFWIRIPRSQKKQLQDKAMHLSHEYYGCVLDTVEDGDYIYIIPHFHDANGKAEPLAEYFNATKNTLSFRRKAGMPKASSTGIYACKGPDGIMQTPMMHLEVEAGKVIGFTIVCDNYVCPVGGGGDCAGGYYQTTYCCVCKIKHHGVRNQRHRKKSR